MVYLISCHSPSQRIRDRNYKKAYLADWSLAQAVSVAGAVSPSRMLENMVFIELLRRRYEVSYFRTREGSEIDFIADRNGTPALAVQVCLNLTTENRDRELKGLPESARYLGLHEAWVITRDQQEDLVLDRIPIHVVPAWRWLLEN